MKYKGNLAGGEGCGGLKSHRPKSESHKPQNPDPITRNPKPGTRNPKPGSGSLNSGPGSRWRRMRGTLTRRQAHPDTYFHFKSDFQVKVDGFVSGF